MWMEKSAWKSLVMVSPVNGWSSRGAFGGGERSDDVPTLRTFKGFELSFFSLEQA